FARVVEPRHKGRSCGLASPRRAHKRVRLTALQFEAHIPENFLAARILEEHGAELKLRIATRWRRGYDRHVRFHRKHFGNTIERGHGELEGLPYRCKLPHRTVEVVYVEQESDQETNGEVARVDQQNTVRDDQELREVIGKSIHRHEDV